MTKELIAEWREKKEGVTPGPWTVYDGCSWRRIGTAHGRADDRAVIAPTTASDGHPDLTCSAGNDREANLAWLAHCSPDNVEKLLALITAQAARIGELEGALRDQFCPRPCNHRPVEFDVGDCVDAGECGCSAARALTARSEKE